MTPETDPMSIEDGSYYESTQRPPSYQSEDKVTNEAADADTTPQEAAAREDAALRSQNQSMLTCKKFLLFCCVGVAGILDCVLLAYTPMAIPLGITLFGFAILVMIDGGPRPHKGLLSLGVTLAVLGPCAFVGIYIAAFVRYDRSPLWHLWVEFHLGWAHPNASQ